MTTTTGIRQVQKLGGQHSLLSVQALFSQVFFEHSFTSLLDERQITHLICARLKYDQ